MNLARRRAAGGVQHHEELDQVLADRRHERLDDINSSPAHAGAQLKIEIVIAESAKKRLLQRH